MKYIYSFSILLLLSIAVLGNQHSQLSIIVPAENITSFSISVQHNNEPISGAAISILQNGKVISSSTTIRGKCKVYIENESAFIIKIVAQGYKTVNKEIQKITQNEVITIQIKK